MRPATRPIALLGALLLAILALGATLTGAHRASAAGTVLFGDDFEADTVGSPAPGWTVNSGTCNPFHATVNTQNQLVDPVNHLYQHGRCGKHDP